MTRAKADKKAEQEAVDLIARAIMGQEPARQGEDRVVATCSYDARIARIVIPAGMRIGQAIVNAMASQHNGNKSIDEDPITALFYVSDDELQKAFDANHKTYGFAR